MNAQFLRNLISTNGRDLELVSGCHVITTTVCMHSERGSEETVYVTQLVIFCNAAYFVIFVVFSLLIFVSLPFVIVSLYSHVVIFLFLGI